MYREFADLCERRNVTPYRVAKECGFSGVSLSDWKSGKSSPNADKLLKMSRYFGVSMEYLMTGENSDHEPLPSVILSEDEDSLLASFRALNKEGRKKAAEYVSDLAGNEKYIKDGVAAGSTAG